MKTRNLPKKRSRFYDLQEIAFSDSSVTVEPERNVIRGVKLLGLESANNATYLNSALASNYHLYEGVDCFIDHPGEPTAPRSYGDKFGKIRNVTYRQGKGLFGDIHYNPKHNLAEQLVWDAENSPESVGLSPNHRVSATQDSHGRKIVDSISKVRSVDLVSNPATTVSLFEHQVESMSKTTLTRLLRQATPYGREFANLLEMEQGLDVTAPIDVLGDMKPAEAVADALAQTAVAIFMDETVSPEETGTKIAELATIVQEVKSKVEPGAAVDVAPEEGVDAISDIEDLASGEGDEEPGSPEVPEAEESSDESAPAEEPSAPPSDGETDEEDEEDEDKKANATEGIFEKKLSKLSKIVDRIDKRDRARTVLESAGVPVDGSKLTELMECKDEKQMQDVMESWSGKRRGMAKPSIGVNRIQTESKIPKGSSALKGRYVIK